MNTHGHLVDANMVLCDAQALPDTTSGDSTNMVDVGVGAGNTAWLYVYANNDVEIASDQAFAMELQCFTADTAASAVSPIDDGHVELLTKTAADGEMAFAAGDLIGCWGLSPEMLGTSRWVQLLFTTDADESDDDVDAFVVFKP